MSAIVTKGVIYVLNNLHVLTGIVSKDELLICHTLSTKQHMVTKEVLAVLSQMDPTERPCISTDKNGGMQGVDACGCVWMCVCMWVYIIMEISTTVWCVCV